jgi:hypothetical protein
MPRGKKQCPSCSSFIGLRTAACECGHKFLFKKNKKKKISKHSILKRIVLSPTKDIRPFFIREMKILNLLCARYSIEFMNIVDFGKKFDSLAYLASPKLKEKMDQKFRAYNYKFDKNKYNSYNIGEKVGEDRVIKKNKKTTRDFLNE